MSYPAPTPAELTRLRYAAEDARHASAPGKDTVGPALRDAEIILHLVEFYERVNRTLQVNAADVYQQKCLRTVKSEPGNPTLTLCALGLGGETGEVIEPVKKHLFHGKPLDPQHVMLELGDVLWYAAVMAHELGWSLSDVMAANVAKLEARHLGSTTEGTLSSSKPKRLRRSKKAAP